MPGTSSPWRGSRTPRPAKRCRICAIRWCWKGSSFPDPVIEIAVEPKTKSDQEKMSSALGRLAQEDPSFRCRSTRRAGRPCSRGWASLHLEILVDRMRREFKVDANVGVPQVAYRRDHLQGGRARVHPPQADRRRRTVRQARSPLRARRSRRRYRVREQGRRRRGAAGVHPRGREGHPRRERGRGARRIPGDRCGGGAARRGQPRGRLVCRGVRNRGRAAFREGVGRAAPKLLEPAMRAGRWSTPEDYLGDIIGDLQSRRGQINAMDSRGNARVVTAIVPLANMFGYVNNLRSMSQGRAQFTMAFRPLRAGAAGHRGGSPRQDGVAAVTG